MSMTGFTNFTTVDGVQEFIIPDIITGTADAVDESILFKAGGAVRASGTGVVTFKRCNIFIDNVVPDTSWFNIINAVLSYNGETNDRNNTTRFVHLEDCSVIFRTTATKAIFISNAINTRIFRRSEGGGSFRVYTQGGAILDGMHLDEIIWEPALQFDSASGLRVENTSTGFTNFNIARMDFLNIAEVNVSTAASLGSGGTNSIVMWNIVSFDNTTINLGRTDSEYFGGISSSWNFKDRDLGTDVDDVLLILNSDISGSMTELGRYTTNSSGLLVGTYDSRFQTTGANQVRDALFLFEVYSDQAGSSHGGGFTYDLIVVTNQIEIRSYMHDAPTGYVVGDDYTLTIPQGSLATDYTTETFQAFPMPNDFSITESNKATVLAYASLGDELKLYDRHKAEWRDNDNYALIGRVGGQLSLGAIDLTLDATASVYTANTTMITAKAATYTGGAMSTTGEVIVKNGALLDGGTFDCNVIYEGGAGTSIANISVTVGNLFTFDTAGTYTLDGCDIDQVENTSGGTVTLNLTNNSTVPTLGSGTFVIIINKDLKFTVSPSIVGYEWRIYEVTALGSLIGSVEVAGEETAVSDNQTYTYNSFLGNKNLAIQIIAQPNEDYEEIVSYYIANANDQDVTINLTRDNNN